MRRAARGRPARGGHTHGDTEIGYPLMRGGSGRRMSFVLVWPMGQWAHDSGNAAANDLEAGLEVGAGGRIQSGEE